MLKIFSIGLIALILLSVTLVFTAQSVFSDSPASKVDSFLTVKEIMENKQKYDNKMVAVKGYVVYKYSCVCAGGVCITCAINHLGIADSASDKDYLIASFFVDEQVYNSFKVGDIIMLKGEYSFSNPVGVSNSYGSLKYDSLASLTASPSTASASPVQTASPQLLSDTPVSQQPLVLASNRLFPVKSFLKDVANEIIPTSEIKNKGGPDEIDIVPDANFGLGSNEGIDVKVFSRVPEADDSNQVISGLPSVYNSQLRVFQITAPRIVRQNMKYGKISFWLAGEDLKNLKKENVVLLRFSNGVWSELNTSIDSTKTDGSTLFSAVTPGFSVFAVATKSDTRNALVQQPTQEARQGNQSVAINSSQANPTPNQTVQLVPSNPPVESKSPASGLATSGSGIVAKNLPVIIVVAAFILGALYFTVKPSKKNKQEKGKADEKADSSLYGGSGLSEMKKEIESKMEPEEPEKQADVEVVDLEDIQENKKEYAPEHGPEVSKPEPTQVPEIVKDSDYLSFHAEPPKSEDGLKPEDLLVIRFVKGKPEIVQWKKGSPKKTKRKKTKQPKPSDKKKPGRNEKTKTKNTKKNSRKKR